jgi:hypothetical protein
MTHCDVVVCGAGISGLLLASELSKHLSVIVLEKNSRLKCSNKFWLTSKECLDINQELQACVDSEWSEMQFVASDRTKFTATGKYILWNTKLLENYLIDKIINSGSKIFYEHRLYSYKRTNSSIISYANNLSFSSSLLIDCMGYSSPIVSSTNAVHILGYYHLYGRVIKLKKYITPVALDNVILSGQPSYLEVFPRSDGFANVVLIASAKNTNSITKLENDFNFIVERSHYSEFFDNPAVGEKLRGIVPIGKIRKTSLDRILFFGEAGQVHPAASCTCLSKLLAQFRRVSEAILHNVNTDQLRAKDLKSVTVRMNKFSQKLHQSMFTEMSGWRSDRAESFLELLHCIDQKSLDDFIFREITLAHFFQYQNLIRVIQKRNFLWVRPFLKSLFTW